MATLFCQLIHYYTERSCGVYQEYLFVRQFKVDREDHFQRPGFLHIIICVFLGYKASNFAKKLNVTDALKTSKFEGFDHESHPRPF